MKINITNITHHRNGVAANGFAVVLFTTGRGKSRQNMVATVFPERGNIAVLDADMTAAGNIKFGENSWRGDEFESQLRSAIAAHVGYEEDDAERRISILAAERDILRNALEASAKLVQTARQRFPKSMRNSDKFQLEQTCAHINAALGV